MNAERTPRVRSCDPPIETLETRIAPARLIALDGPGTSLLAFESSNPGNIQITVPISGLGGGESIHGIDFRPDTGELFGVAINGTAARIGTLNLATGAFTQIGSPFTVNGSDFGFDFNPTNDRIRLTSDSDINFLINPNDGVVTVQSLLNPGNPNIVGSAYSNNFGSATVTTLFDIDSTTDQLLSQVPATGTLTPIGSLGVDAASALGFDIAGNGTAFASLLVAGSTRLYTINVANGNATLIGQIGMVVTPIRDIAVQRFVWDGGGANSNWTTAANWVGDVAPSASDDLVFPNGAARLVNNNNYLAGTVFNSLTFNGLNYDISGNGINLSRGIATNVPLGGAPDLGPVFRPGINLLSAQTFEGNGARGVSLRGPLALNGASLSITGVAPLSIDGDISGAGTIGKSGGGPLFLTGDNTYTGLTTISAGIVNVRSDNALGASGAGNETLVVPGGTLSIEFGSTVPESLMLNGGGAGGIGALVNGLGNNSLTGAITMGSATTIGNPVANTSFSLSGSIANGGSLLTVNNVGQVAISGAISGTGGLVKSGGGTLVLSGTNSYAGTTTLNGGVLFVEGAVVSVNVNGGTLSGSGTIGSLTAFDGTVAPGTGPGSLSVSGVANFFGGNFAVELNGLTAGTEYDQIVVAGQVIAGGSLVVTASPALNDGDSFTIIKNDGLGAIVSTFLGLPEGAVLNSNGQFFIISYVGGDGNDVVLTKQVSDFEIAANGRSATYTDATGDIVTVKTSRGKFENADFDIVPSGSTGNQLRRLILGEEFAGANITVSARPGPDGGDGIVNVGAIDATVPLGKISIAGDLGRIDAGSSSGEGTAIASLRVHSLGVLGTRTQDFGGSLQSVIHGKLGALIVRGDIRDADISVIADDDADAAIGRIKIGGSLLGGNASQSGVIIAEGAIGPIVIGRDLVGGDGSFTPALDKSGYIQGQRIASISIGGSMIGGQSSGFPIPTILTDNASIRALDDLGRVSVKGNIVGNATQVFITARGEAAPKADKDLAIKSLTVGGNVENARILAGYGLGNTPLNADAQIGKVSVGGDWIISNLVAGVMNAASFNQSFGNANDAKISGPGTTDTTAISKIARILIKGQLLGTDSSFDHFGLVAEQIVAAQIGSVKLSLTKGPGNDDFPLGATGDVNLREIEVL